MSCDSSAVLATSRLCFANTRMCVEQFTLDQAPVKEVCLGLSVLCGGTVEEKVRAAVSADATNAVTPTREHCHVTP